MKAKTDSTVNPLQSQSSTVSCPVCHAPSNPKLLFRLGNDLIAYFCAVIGCPVDFYLPPGAKKTPEFMRRFKTISKDLPDKGRSLIQWADHNLTLALISSSGVQVVRGAGDRPERIERGMRAETSESERIPERIEIDNEGTHPARVAGSDRARRWE